jgi:hypothetical protein
MGKKAVHTGESPKDRSINIMDKFIARNNKQAAHKPVLPARRKDPSVTIEMWPLKDQLEYWENRTDADRFDEEYTHYSKWINEVQIQSGVHSSMFISYIKPIQDVVTGLFESKTRPGKAARQLQKYGVY